jgi:hypothetical protein
LSDCILSPLALPSTCDSALGLAQNGLDNYLQSNVQQLLSALAEKMNSNGIVVLLSYAQFFDTTTDACTTEDWSLYTPSLFQAGFNANPLTPNLRATMNTMVQQANAALSNAVTAAQQGTSVPIRFANWDAWPATVGGRFCEAGSASDPFAIGTGSDLELQFFKLDTTVWQQKAEWFNRRRSLVNATMNWGESPETKMRMRKREERGLIHRDITDPQCPTAAFSVSDRYGKLFHPTLNGHTSMMTYALDVVRSWRAEQLGLASPSCVINGMNCNLPADLTSASSYMPYTSLAAINDAIPNFCSMVSQAIGKGQGGTPFSWSYSYFDGTPDEVVLKVQFDLSNNPQSYWSTSDCNTYFSDIFFDCWTRNAAANPLQWCFGGNTLNGHWTYTMSPQVSNRPWPLPTASLATVDAQLSTDNGIASYLISGAGWASFDYGQQSLLANFTYCNGGKAPNVWAFEYTTALGGGYEWQAFIQAYAEANINCMTNGDVVLYSGGPPNTQISWSQSLPSWSTVCPGVNPDTLSCDTSCNGYVECGAWCSANCGGLTHS